MDIIGVVGGMVNMTRRWRKVIQPFPEQPVGAREPRTKWMQEVEVLRFWGGSFEDVLQKGSSKKPPPDPPGLRARARLK
jgi:hypothetical protein